MKRLMCFVVLALLPAASAWAGTRTVTLRVSHMTCATCPLTVKLALNKVAGVSKTAVDFGKKEAVVTFDDAKTHVAALITATTNAGYPSSVKNAGKQ